MMPTLKDNTDDNSKISCDYKPLSNQLESKLEQLVELVRNHYTLKKSRVVYSVTPLKRLILSRIRLQSSLSRHLGIRSIQRRQLLPHPLH